MKSQPLPKTARLDDASFIQSMVRLKLPEFPGIGIRTRKQRTVEPKYSGRFFLARCLHGAKRNGKVVFTSEAF